MSLCVQIKKAWVRTGDLGAFFEGQLYVTGRLKEMICIRGVNFYPHDIEDAVRASHPSIRPGSVVALSTADPHPEGLAVLVELTAPATSSSAAPSTPGKLGKGDIAMAQRIFKVASRLPAVARAPAIRGLAKLGAWWMAGRGGGGAKGEKGEQVQGPGQEEEVAEAVERAIKRAVLCRFGIPVADVILARAVRHTSYLGWTAPQSLRSSHLSPLPLCVR